jgi:hypothetical protein
MMLKLSVPGLNRTLLRGIVLAGALVAVSYAQLAQLNTSPAPAASPSPVATTTYHPIGSDARARKFYKTVWGVDSLNVKWVESGEMIRFSYTILDPDKAAQLNDKKANPLLLDESARVSLVVPSLEKVGQLRQSGTPEAGRSYWMVFSNKHRVVKQGDHVSIVIGKFRVDGLIVQ